MVQSNRPYLYKMGYIVTYITMLIFSNQEVHLPTYELDDIGMMEILHVGSLFKALLDITWSADISF